MYIAYAATASQTTAPLADRLFEAFVIMIIGMGAVFLMLTISMFGMMLIGKIASPKQEEPKPASVSSTSEVADKVLSKTASEEDADAEIAAIVAVFHHMKRKTAVSVPIIKRKDI